MANKFILVPNDQYKALMMSPKHKKEPPAQPAEPPPLLPPATQDVSEPAMRFTKRRMAALLKKPRGRPKNESTTRALYNQELQRHLRQRKAASEKPVRVVISKEKKRGKKKAADELPVVAIDETGTPLGTSTASTVAESIRADTQAPTLIAPSPAATTTTTTTPSSASTETTPAESTPSAGQAKSKRLQELTRRIAWTQERREQLEKIILEHAGEFGIVSSSGAILGQTNKPIANSNYKESLNKITAPTNVGESPPGTGMLRNRMLRHNLTSTLLRSFLADTQTQTGLGWVSLTWN